MGSVISGQLSLSNPGAFSRVDLSTSRMNSCSASFNVSAFHGTANSLLPMPRNPPNDSTAYAMRPEGTSIIISSILPRSSPAALRTLSPASVPADITRLYSCPFSVVVIVFSFPKNRGSIPPLLQSFELQWLIEPERQHGFRRYSHLFAARQHLHRSTAESSRNRTYCRTFAAPSRRAEERTQSCSAADHLRRPLVSTDAAPLRPLHVMCT